MEAEQTAHWFMTLGVCFHFWSQLLCVQQMHFEEPKLKVYSTAVSGPSLQWGEVADLHPLQLMGSVNTVPTGEKLRFSQLGLLLF